MLKRRLKRLGRRIAGLTRSIGFRAKRTAAWKRRYRRTNNPADRRKLHESIRLGRGLRKARRTLVARQRRFRQRISDRLWGGSRAVTNEIIHIVGDRAEVTSRKRWELFGNPNSDHYVGKRNADADTNAA